LDARSELSRQASEPIGVRIDEENDTSFGNCKHDDYFRVESAVIWQLNTVISRVASSSGIAVWTGAQVT
jgi:hypothetical protein